MGRGEASLEGRKLGWRLRGRHRSFGHPGRGGRQPVRALRRHSGGQTFTSTKPTTSAFRRSMVGSAGTRQPAARRSQACRRACPAHDAGVHLRPRLGPANSLSAVRVRGRRAVVKGVGVRPPSDGQAAADDAWTRAAAPPTLCRHQRSPQQHAHRGPRTPTAPQNAEDAIEHATPAVHVGRRGVTHRQESG